LAIIIFFAIFTRQLVIGVTYDDNQHHLVLASLYMGSFMLIMV